MFGATVLAGVYPCHDPLIENNSITIETGNWSGCTVYPIKFLQGCSQGYVGPHTWFLRGTNLTSGSNLIYISEDARTNFSGPNYALRAHMMQNGYTGFPGLGLQYRSQFSESIADDNVLSIKPKTNVGIILMSAGYGGGSAVLGYSINAGVVYAISAGANVNPIGTSTVLTGTTGTDGRINVAVSTANFRIYVENRMGSALTISVITGPGFTS